MGLFGPCRGLHSLTNARWSSPETVDQTLQATEHGEPHLLPPGLPGLTLTASSFGSFLISSYTEKNYREQRKCSLGDLGCLKSLAQCTPFLGLSTVGFYLSGTLTFMVPRASFMTCVACAVTQALSLVNVLLSPIGKLLSSSVGN